MRTSKRVNAIFLQRFAEIMAVRGTILIVMGALAVRWPDELLVPVTIAAATTVGLLGLVETIAAILSRTLASTRSFLVAAGLLHVALGGVLMATQFASIETTLSAVSAWLLAAALFVLLLAGRLWYSRAARVALLSAGIFLAVLPAALVWGRIDDITTLTYYAALFLFAFGVAQAAAAQALRHGRLLVATTPQATR